MEQLNKYIENTFKIDSKVINFINKQLKELEPQFAEIDARAEYNQLKVLSAMQKNHISDTHFGATNGYGYNDLGRDALEQVYADIFNAESALVRPQLISGTHALTIALSGNLRPGDEILSPVGAPYDTLQGVIGITEQRGSLKEYGITYRQVDFKDDYSFDYEGIKNAINQKTKLVTIQRSKGYDFRPALTIAELKELISFIKSIKPDVICMVDNCYGEFVETLEPTDVGADLAVGSLIKNPGGGLAPIGGYIVGKEEYVENAAVRLTAPGQGKEVGATLGLNSVFFQGLFLSPTVVAASLKGALLTAKVFENLGYETMPKSTDLRADIVQAVKMQSADKVIAFCKGIQKAAPIDSYVTPEPNPDMPGYDSPVIMAAGAFVQGSSIELSADAPIKPPYTVYFQGGLTWYHAKLGVMVALQEMYKNGLVELNEEGDSNA